MRGLGNGDFEPVWPNQSGLFVPGDGKGLATLDLNGDGWVDFAVTENNGPVAFFVNSGFSENQPFAVDLIGKPGNTTAAGARVSVILDDGSSQTAEVYAGSGYLTQSTNTLFFGLRKGGPAVRVDVRWPDGTENSHRIDADGRRSEIHQP